MSIEENLLSIRESMPLTVTLVAVTKTKSPGEIMEAYNTGHREFGENKVQELTSKAEVLPKDIHWHMIGHLQRNKVKYIAPIVSLIHSVDSLKLLREINKQGQKCQRIIPCLFQIHIAEESTKFGLDESELFDIVKGEEFKTLDHIRIEGLMGMATFTEDMNKVRREFQFLSKIFDSLKEYLPNINTLSMGMSGDYELAIEEGSTMVRIGSSIFGARNNN